MKMNNELRIPEELIKNTPNDFELGERVRELYNQKNEKSYERNY